MSVFDKLKSAAGTAAGAVAGAAGTAAGAVAGAAGAAASAVAGAAGDLLSAGVDKLQAWVDDIAAASPHLQGIGYRLGDLKVELSLSPRVLVELVKEADVPDEAFQAVLANHPNETTLRTLVRMAGQANRIAKRVQPKGRRFQSLEVELGLPPAARMRYVECPEPPAPPAEAPPARALAAAVTQALKPSLKVE
jgi:hypothetical protein